MCRRNGLRRKVTVLVNPRNIAQTEATSLEVRDAACLRALGIEAPETLLADRRRTDSGPKGTARVVPVWPHNQTAAIAAMYTPLQVRVKNGRPSPAARGMDVHR